MALRLFPSSALLLIGYLRLCEAGERLVYHGDPNEDVEHNIATEMVGIQQAAYDHKARAEVSQHIEQTMSDAMKALNDPKLVAEAAKMMKDPNFRQNLQQMAKDPNFKTYINAMQGLMQHPAVKPQMDHMANTVKSEL